MKVTPLVLLGFLFGCAAMANERDWAFVESVGGMKVDDPVRERGEWLLPIHADVSGLKEITVKPTTLNSGIACKETHASVDGNVIYLRIFTSAITSGLSPECPPAKLGQIRPGPYIVFYAGTRLREVTIGL